MLVCHLYYYHPTISIFVRFVLLSLVCLFYLLSLHLFSTFVFLSVCLFVLWLRGRSSMVPEPVAGHGCVGVGFGILS